MWFFPPTWSRNTPSTPPTPAPCPPPLPAAASRNLPASSATCSAIPGTSRIPASTFGSMLIL